MAKMLTFWGVIGLLLAVIGGVVAIANWPDTTTKSEVTVSGLQPSVTSVTETGSEAAANVGLIMLGVGSTVLWVVLIAFGVYCGLRMKEEHEERREARRQVEATIADKNRQAREDRQRRMVAKPADEERPTT